MTSSTCYSSVQSLPWPPATHDAAADNRFVLFFFFFFFNDTATTEIYTLSLHDALPIWHRRQKFPSWRAPATFRHRVPDRKSTRLNSSHGYISYAVFCLKKKQKQKTENNMATQRQHHMHARLSDSQP